MSKLNCASLEMRPVVDDPGAGSAATTGFDILDAESCFTIDCFQRLADGCLQRQEVILYCLDCRSCCHDLSPFLQAANCTQFD